MPKKVIKEVDAHVGARVRKRRMAIGVSQKKLAEAIGLTFQQVQKYEKGSNRIGSSRLVQIANALGVSPNFFFEEAPGAGRGVATQNSSMQLVADFVASKEGDKLMKAFLKLTTDIQRCVVALVEKVAAKER